MDVCTQNSQISRLRNKLNNITIRQIFLNHKVARSLHTNAMQFYYVFVVESPAKAKRDIRKTASEKSLVLLTLITASLSKTVTLYSHH